MDFFNEAKQKIKEAKKKWKALKIIGGILSAVAPILLFGILFIIFLSPLLLFIDKTASIFNPDGSQNNKKTFEAAILKKEEHYNGDPYHVQIDKELILAVLLYGRGYGFGKEYSVDEKGAEDGTTIDCDLEDPDDCFGERDIIPLAERRKLIRYSNYLADGMVKQYYEYTCTHFEEKEYWDCNDEAFNFNNHSAFDLNSYYLRLVPIDGGGGVGDNCTKVKKNVDVYTNFCGESPNLFNTELEQNCKSLCEDDQRVDKELKYGLKTKEEFITWLKLSQFELDEYGDWGYNLGEKLKDVGVTLHPGTEGEEELDKIIEEIYDLYETIKKNSEPDGGGYIDDIADPYGGDYGEWSQLNPAWSWVKIGKTATLGKYGCLATSIAIQVKRSGSRIDYGYLGSNSFNPGTWAQKIKQEGRFNDGGYFQWVAPGTPISRVCPNFIYVGMYGAYGDKVSQIANYLSQGYYVIIDVRPQSGHWVAVTGVSNGDITIADPGGRNCKSVRSCSPTYSTSYINNIILFKRTD